MAPKKKTYTKKQKYNYYKRYGKWPSKNGKKSYNKNKSYTSKLMDKKINTGVEVRMLQIAKKEDAKNRINLIIREYWWCSGMMLDYNRFSGGAFMQYNGYCKRIATIDKIDINQPLNVPQIQDPDLWQHPDFPFDTDGVTQGMTTDTIQMRRQTDIVKITGFTLGLRVHLNAVQTLFQDDEIIPPETPLEVHPDQPPRVLRPIVTVVLKYAIIGVLRRENAIGHDSPNPQVDELMPWNTWGYTPRLDHSERQKRQWGVKTRTFLKGECSMSISTTRHQAKEIEKFVRLDDPLIVNYAPHSQTGEQTQDWMFYLVIRSNVPHDSPTQTYDYTPFAPQVSAFTKTHYFE